MTIFYNNEQVSDLIDNGGQVPKSGKYKVWVMAKEGSNVQFELDGNNFEKTHTGEKTDEFSWVEAGQVQLESNKLLDVKVSPSELVGEISIAFETMSEHKLYHGFVNMMKKVFTKSD